MKASEALMMFDQFLRDSWYAPETARKFTIYTSQFINSIGDKEVADIGIKDIDSYVNRSDEAHLQTRIKRLQIVRKFIRFCRSNGWADNRFPEIMVRVNRRILQPRHIETMVRIPFTEDELAILLKHATGNLACFKPAIEIAMETGLRISDIFSLKWSQVGTRTLIVFTQKSGYRIPIMMSDKLMATLDSMPQRPPMSHVLDELRNKREIPLFGWDLIEKNIRMNGGYHSSKFKLLCVRAGIKGKTFHCIRHYYVDKCRRLGIATPHISALVGHTNEQTTKGYGLSFIVEPDHPLRSV